MEYGGLIMTEQNYTTKILAIFAAILTGVTGFFSGQAIHPGQELYVCESKAYISDCVNGVKADGLRCYYDPENARRYKECPEGWGKKPAENILARMGITEPLNERELIICAPDNQGGCV